VHSSIETYKFVANSPTKWVDPFGLKEFYVVGTLVEEEGGDDETPSQKIGRKVGQILDIDHVDIYYGTRLALIGYAPRPETLGAEQNVSRKILATLERVDKAGRVLRWGQYAGTCCSKVTDEMRLASLLASPSPTGGTENYNVACNNCQTDVKHAIEGSCLTGYETWALGPSEDNYLSPEEKKRLQEKHALPLALPFIRYIY
jgi:hypothetical protein